METEQSILVGVIAGVLTSALIYMIVTIFNRVLIPWYRAAIYRGLDISGAWEEEVNHGAAIDFSVYVFEQHERHISGTKTIIKTYTDSRGKKTKRLTLRGELRDGTLMFFANNEDKGAISHATYLLRVEGGGERLVGNCSWLDVESGKIESRMCEFRKAKA